MRPGTPVDNVSNRAFRARFSARRPQRLLFELTKTLRRRTDKFDLSWPPAEGRSEPQTPHLGHIPRTLFYTAGGVSSGDSASAAGTPRCFHRTSTRTTAGRSIDGPYQSRHRILVRGFRASCRPRFGTLRLSECEPPAGSEWRGQSWITSDGAVHTGQTSRSVISTSATSLRCPLTARPAASSIAVAFRSSGSAEPS